MTINNIPVDVNALVTTSSSSPPQFRLNNFQQLADAINAGAGTGTLTESITAVNVPIYAAATAPVQLAAAATTRKSLVIHNPSANPLRVAFANTAGAPIHVVISSLGTITFNNATFPYTGAVFGISHNGTGYQVVVMEVK